MGKTMVAQQPQNESERQTGKTDFCHQLFKKSFCGALKVLKLLVLQTCHANAVEIKNI